MTTGTEALGPEQQGQGTRLSRKVIWTKYTQKQELQRGSLKVSVLSLLVHCEVDQWRALGRCSGRSTDLVVIIGSIEVSAVRNQLSLETIGGE
jgi:hypothetical protein